MEKVVFVILEGFADWEYAPLAAELASPQTDHPAYQVLFASDTMDLKTSIGGLKARPDLVLKAIPQDTAALVLVGGVSWRKSEAAPVADVARRFLEQGKVVGAICDAARFLAANGLLNDHLHTLNFQDDAAEEALYQNPAGYRPSEAVRDNNLVTANGNAPYHFGREMLMALGTRETEAVKWYDFFTLGFHQALQKYFPEG